MANVLIVGFGGQGVLTLGGLLAYAAMKENKGVAWLPSYSPETRGGHCICQVIVSETQPGSPIADCYETLIAMNQVMLESYISKIERNGLLIVNVPLVQKVPDGYRVIEISANRIAEESGNELALNMVMFGAYLAVRPVVGRKTAEEAIRQHFPKLIEPNLQAFGRGWQIGEKYRT